MLFAEAGLSECARAAACSAEFDRPFYIAGALGIVAVWLYSSLYATVSVERTKRPIVSKRRWVAVIWLVPFAGSAAWFWSDTAARVARSAARDTHQTHASDNQ